MKTIGRGILLSGLGFSLLFAVGCGKSDSGPAPSAPGASSSGTEATPAPATKKKWDPAMGTATLSGVVTMKGSPPPAGKIDMSGNKECVECNKTTVYDPELIANNGKLKNAFVWVEKGLEGWEFPVPTEPVMFDQKGCMYSPHVVGVQVGQPFTVRNSDTFKHNVNLAVAKKQDPFNPVQEGGSSNTIVFKNPEVMCTFKCNIHSWMTAHVGILDHPYFCVTGEDGSYQLPKLPPGKYTVKVWHEHWMKTPKKIENVEVKDKETKGDVNFEFEEK